MTNEAFLKFKDSENKIIIPYLKKVFPSLKSACCLYHMIEQIEDVYTYLINSKDVIFIEVSRLNNSINHTDILSIKDYAIMKKGKQYHRYMKEIIALSNSEIIK